METERLQSPTWSLVPALASLTLQTSPRMPALRFPHSGLKSLRGGLPLRLVLCLVPTEFQSCVFSFFLIKKATDIIGSESQSQSQPQVPLGMSPTEGKWRPGCAAQGLASGRRGLQEAVPVSPVGEPRHTTATPFPWALPPCPFRPAQNQPCPPLPHPPHPVEPGPSGLMRTLASRCRAES